MAELPNSERGTIVFLVGGLEPWPAPTRALLMEHQLLDGLLIIETDPTGTIQIYLLKQTPEGLFQEHAVRSSQLVAEKMIPLMVGISWRDHRIRRIMINGDLAFHYEKPGEAVRPIILRERAGGKRRDYSAASERASQERYQSMRGLEGRHADPQRVPADKQYMMDALADEVAQLQDLLSLVREGKESHVLGLSSRLRLLIDGKPLGLLQHCAAYHKLPLTVYVMADPEREDPIPASIKQQVYADAAPSDLYSNPVDLDIWLKFPGLTIGERSYTNREVIKELGNKIGSHRDPNISKVVRIMGSAHAGGTPRYRDVARYLVKTSELILSLAEQVLSRRIE